MSSADLRVATIVGSVRTGRFGDRVGAWVHDQLTGAGIASDVIDLADLTFPHTMDAHPDVASFTERIGRADAFVVVAPEYNHSFPGPLKTAIDTVRDEWRAKAVGFVSYGGMAGGLRSVEALRLVFAELHAVTVRDAVSLHNPWGPAGDPAVDHPDDAAGLALTGMVRQLLWWAAALRAARSHQPYPA